MKISWIEKDVIAASGVPVGQKDILSLYEQGIRAIVTLTEHPITIQKELSLEGLNQMGLTYFHAPVVDQYPPDVGTVWQVTKFVNHMKSENKPVLFHCQAGVGRTGTMLHAYYLVSGMTLADVQLMVKQTRPTSQFIMLSDAQQAFLLSLAEKVGHED